MATLISSAVLASAPVAPPANYPLPPAKPQTALSADMVHYNKENPIKRIKVPQEPEREPNPSIMAEFEGKQGKHGGQCVEFIQRHFGSYYSDPDFRGYAGDIVPNSQDPEVGAVVLTLESNGIGHAAIVGEIDYSSSTPELILVGSNYEGDETIQVGERRMFTNDWRIRGYFIFKDKELLSTRN